MFKNLRSFLSYSRIPLRIAARQDGHKLYRVRVVPQRKRVHTYLRSLLIFGGFHVAASIMLETFTSKREGPLFVPIIPIWFAKEEHQEKYETSSPEFQVFVSFSQDKNKHDIVRKRVVVRLLKILARNPDIRFGGNLRTEVPILYYHYPSRPPPKYVRKGIQISPASRGNISFNGILYPLRIFTLKYEWVSRKISHTTMYRLSNTLYPYNLFYSIYSSVSKTFNWLYTLRDSNHKVDSMSDLVAVGKTAVQRGLNDTHRMFSNMVSAAPAPAGSVFVDGVVNVSGNDMVLGVDFMVSFNPKTPEELRFHRVRIRYAKRRYKQPATTVVGGPKGTIGSAVKSAVEIQKQEKKFVEKEEKIDKQQEERIRKEEPGDTKPLVRMLEEGPGDAKPLVRMLEEERGAQISDSSPNAAVDKNGRNKEQKADVDDAASSKP